MVERMERLTYWCQKVIPLVYDDSLSYYELLCKVVKYINDLITNQNAIKDVLALNGQDIDTLQSDIKYLQDELTKVKNGEYVSFYINALSEWIDNNLQQLVAKIAKFVSFELNTDGYFIAIIPDSWSEIHFSSTADGNLVLEY